MDLAQTLTLLLVAITNMITAYLVVVAKRDIKKIEIATNSLTDRLVAKTDLEAHARGVKDEKERDK